MSCQVSDLLDNQNILAYAFNSLLINNKNNNGSIRDVPRINKMMNILLWLTNRPAYWLIKKIRWEMEVTDLADKIRNID